ncbi:MAG: DUF2905 domain-containing protein [Leptospiraceae bacterium]|nr:DUF2905 domain-containing protein [Leptospiraceae bacterium]MDW8306156.1 DUF2905 domain-containing protein [Leptospiraceae bacterium]
MQRILFFLGLFFLIAALLWPYISRLPLGRLPGDIVIEKGRFAFYFPIITSLLLSLLLTLLLNLFWRRF